MTVFWIHLWSLYRKSNVKQVFLNVIYHLEGNCRAGTIVIFAIHVLAHGLEASTKMLSLYTFFYQDSFHKDKKGQKSLKEKNFLKNCLGSSFVIQRWKRWTFLLLISCCYNEIVLSLSFDANLAKLCPILGKLYYTYYILHVY